MIAKATDHPDVRFIPFSQEELVFILTPEHPLAKKKTVSFTDLAKEPIIMKETGSGTRNLVNGLFEKKGISPNILMETSNTEFIKQLVQRGDGVSFVVREAVTTELQEGKMATVPVEGKKIYLDSAIQVTYFPRESLKKLAVQYFKYGRGRCYTTLKHRRITSLRQIGPILLVIILLFCMILSFKEPLFLGIRAAP